MAKTFAHILNNIVTNVIVADSKETAELVTSGVCVEYTDSNPVGIGWTYNFETESFIPPTVQE